MWILFWTATRCLVGIKCWRVAAVSYSTVVSVYLWITSCAYKSNAGQSVPLQICRRRVKQSPAGRERFIVCFFTKKMLVFYVMDEFELISYCILNPLYLYNFNNRPHSVISDSVGHHSPTPDAPAVAGLRCPARAVAC